VSGISTSANDSFAGSSNSTQWEDRVSNHKNHETIKKKKEKERKSLNWRKYWVNYEEKIKVTDLADINQFLHKYRLAIRLTIEYELSEHVNHDVGEVDDGTNGRRSFWIQESENEKKIKKIINK
jgi:hypothetical protein